MNVETNMTANESAAMSKADELRAKRIATSKLKFDRLTTGVVTALQELTSHTRETAGVLTEANAERLNALLSEQTNTLAEALMVHITSPAAVKRKEKPAGVTLF